MIVNNITWRHWIILLLTAALFGSSFFFIKIAVSEIPPLTIAAGRAIGASLLIGIIVFSRSMSIQSSWSNWFILFIVGMLTAVIPYAAIAWGQTTIDSALAGILFATIPVFTVLLAPIFLTEEKFSIGKLLGVSIGVIGVTIIILPRQVTGFENQTLGIILTLLAAMSYALGGIYAKNKSHINPLILAFGQIFTASIILTILSITFESPWALSPSPKAIASLVATAIVSTAFPVILFFWLVGQIGPVKTSLLTFFIPVSAVLLGTLILGEGLRWSSYLGFIFIICGALVVSKVGAHQRVDRENLEPISIGK